MKKILLFITFLALLPALVFAAPRVTVYPKLLEKTDDTITVNWDDGADGVYAPACEIIYGAAPNDYVQDFSQTASGEAVFTPSSVGMTGGVYYCRVSDTTDGSWSAEFKLYIEKETSPVLISPENDEAVDSLNPVFSWNPTSGVPFYTVAVFDAEIEIDLFGGTIDMTADPIWAANTNQTSIAYGTPDPMGYYDRITPPKLTAGKTYTWVVLHNYSGSPAILSESYISMRTFTVTPVSAASPPSLVSPADGVTITARPVVLEWDAALNANSYEVHLRKSETASDESFAGSGNLPVWSTETTGTSVSVPSNIALGDASYSWYVIAIDSTGKGASSAKRIFHNTESEAHINVSINTNGPLGIESVPRTMMYVETASGGNVNLFPYTTGDTGMSFYLPPGDYNFTIRKEGYDTEVFSRSVVGTGDHNFTFTLSKSLYSITGRILEEGTSNPLEGVDINAVFGAHSSDAVSLSGGHFIVYVNSPDIWNLVFDKTGYKQMTAAVSVSSYDTDAGDLFMAKNMNTLSGSVMNESAQAINSARVRVSENGNASNYYDVYTNESGSYTILLPDGDWNAAVSKTGFIAPPSKFVSLSGGSSAVRDFTMTSAANEISGSVNYSGFGMDGVLVRAIPESGPVVEAYTDIYGQYSLSVGTGYFVVNALESGYDSDGPKGITFASGGLSETGVDFEMTQDAAVNDAAVYIYVDDSSVPLEGVYIYMEGSNTFTAGYTASAYTDASGGVTITAMHEGDYNVTASKSGYDLNSLGVQLLSGTVVSHSISLSADVSPAGTIGGYVSDGTNPLAAAEVSLYDPAFPETPLAVTHTASDGLYSFETPAGDYMLEAVLSGYVSPSGAKYASVASSESVQVDFIMQQAVPASISINPYTGKIYNENIGGPYVFEAVLEGEEGEVIDSDFVWSAAPASAGTVSASGVFTPTGDYIGKASIKAEASGISSSHDVMVWQKLDSSYGDVSVSDYAGFSLDIPAGSASASNTIDSITMTKYAPSAVKGSSGTKKVTGNIYNLTEGFGFTENITITMPVPAEYREDSVAAGVWNSEVQKWESIESAVSGDFISAETDHFSEYAVLAEMDELKLDYARIVPNPFSPKYHAGARITFAISSTEGSSVETTIQVFNMGNRLIRTLALNELKAAGTEHTVVWDGRNEDGKWAANGRYFVRVQIEDTGGTKQYLFSVAVVK